MTSRRLLKAAEAIREVVSMAILAELKDPRVQHVTVTKVEVLPDMKQAKVFVTIMGDEKHQNLAMHGLRNSAGFLQHKIASRIETRYTPKLEFVIDEGVKNALEIDRILRRVLPQDESGKTAGDAPQSSDDRIADGNPGDEELGGDVAASADDTRADEQDTQEPGPSAGPH